MALDALTLSLGSRTECLLVERGIDPEPLVPHSVENGLDLRDQSLLLEKENHIRCPETPQPSAGDTARQSVVIGE